MQNPQISKGGSTLDHLMPLHISFPKLALMGGSSCTELPKSIAFGCGILLSHILKLPGISNEKPSISIKTPSISIEILGISNHKFRNTRFFTP